MDVNKLPDKLILPLVEPIRIFVEGMSNAEDQHYNTFAAADLMVEAACSSHPVEHLNELVQHFTNEHKAVDRDLARGLLAALAASILEAVNFFKWRVDDGRFPYIHLETTGDGLYLMAKILI